MKAKKKTALVLAGGGSRGAYEAGVWQALRELDIEIDAVFGTSVGSLNGAVIAQDDFELCINIWKELETQNVFSLDIQKDSGKQYTEIAGMPSNEAAAYLKELAKGGAHPSGLEDMLKTYVDEKAIRESRIEYGLTTYNLSLLKPLHLRIEDIPEGKLHDYIIASCSVAPAIRAREIDGDQYIDGGYHDSLPVSMALASGATDIIAVNLKAPGIYRQEDQDKAREKCNSYVEIASNWDLGNMLAFNKQVARRLMRLGYLDTLKAYGILSGNYYAFPAKEMGKRDLIAGELAAKVFELNPEIIYTKQSLDEAISRKIKPLLAKKSSLKIELTTLKNFAKEIVTQKDGEELVTILIASELKKPHPNPLLETKPVRKVLGDYITAARYLIAYDLI